MSATTQAMYTQHNAVTLAAAFPETGTAQALDLLQIKNSSGALLAKVNSTGVVGGGATGSAVLTAAALNALVLTAAAVSTFTLTSVVGASATYVGTITGGASNAMAGKQVIVAGFAASAGANNGTFTILTSSATQFTVAVTTQVDETHAGTAQVSGFSQVTFTGTITGGGTNNFAGKTAVIAGFAAGSGANNGTYTIVSNDTTHLVALAQDNQVAETHAGTANILGVTTVTFTGTISGGGSSGLAGATAVVAGFAAGSGANNGTYTVLSSDATHIVALAKAGNVNETHAGTAAITLTGTNGTRIGVFLTRLPSTATLAQLFADAFSNPALQDIIQVLGQGNNVVYYLDYLGVAH